MGANASVSGPVNEAKAKELAGSHYDEAKFKELAGESGEISADKWNEEAKKHGEAPPAPVPTSSLSGAAARESMRRGHDALGAISKADVRELKALANPPSGVDKVLSCVAFLISGKAVDWAGAKKLLGDAQFLQKCLDLDPATISPEKWSKVNFKYTSKEFFNPEVMKKKSKAVAGLAEWVLSLEAAVIGQDESIRDGRYALGDITKVDISELRDVWRPNRTDSEGAGPLGQVFSCAALLINGTDDWADAMQLLDDDQFHYKCLHLDPASVSPETWAKVKTDYTSKDLFARGQLSDFCKGYHPATFFLDSGGKAGVIVGGGLVKWVLCIEASQA